jgi:hypothetical protein
MRLFHHKKFLGIIKFEEHKNLKKIKYGCFNLQVMIQIGLKFLVFDYFQKTLHYFYLIKKVGQHDNSLPVNDLPEN